MMENSPSVGFARHCRGFSRTGGRGTCLYRRDICICRDVGIPIDTCEFAFYYEHTGSPNYAKMMVAHGKRNFGPNRRILQETSKDDRTIVSCSSLPVLCKPGRLLARKRKRVPGVFKINANLPRIPSDFFSENERSHEVTYPPGIVCAHDPAYLTLQSIFFRRFPPTPPTMGWAGAHVAGLGLHPVWVFIL